MSIWDGSTQRLSFQPTKQDLEELFPAARRANNFQTGRGLLALKIGETNAIHLEPIHNNPHNIRAAFVGVIVQQGPPDATGVQAEDYQDARYWVREVVETSAGEKLNERPVWEKKTVFWQSLYPDVLPDEPRLPKGRWLTAYNLAEGNFLDKDQEVHSLAVDGTVVVHVFAVASPANSLHFYFTSGGSGSGDNMAFAVVRKINEPEDIQLEVRQVFINDGGVPEFHVERDSNNVPVPNQNKVIWTWPGTRAKHYAAYQWDAESPNFETSILPVVRIDGKFFLQQYNRYSLQPRDPRVRTTDCQQAGP